MKEVKASPDPKAPNKKKAELEKKLGEVSAKVEAGKKDVAEAQAKEAEKEAQEAVVEKELNEDKAALKAYEDK